MKVNLVSKIVLLFTFFCFLAYSQEITIVDPKSKKIQVYREVQNLPNGQSISKNNVDGVTIIEKSGKFYKASNYSSVSPYDFGAKGDAIYNNTGDLNALKSGIDDTSAFVKFFSSRNTASSAGSHMGGTVFFIPSSKYRLKGNYEFRDHYSTILGEGIGSTVIHMNTSKNADLPLFLFGRIASNNAWDSLLTGGGVENLQINSDNTSIRNYAIVIDYAEYMNFQNVGFRNIGKSAIKGGFWESNFQNIKIESSGQLQTADAAGNPQTGLIDFQNESSNRFKDASNNSHFTKITFSSCTGTLLKLASAKNTTVNINFNGLYAETYPGYAGNAENLPLIYSKNSKNITIDGGFITVNSSNTERNGKIIVLDDNSGLSFSNFNFLMNPVDGYLKRSVRRLANIATVNRNCILSLKTVEVQDPTDSVGFGLDSAPSFFDGDGKIILDLVKFHILSNNSGGTRRITNLIDRKLQATGSALVMMYDRSGPNQSLQLDLSYQNGNISVLADVFPQQDETWQIGDKIVFKNPQSGSLGKICVEPGTSGKLEKIVANGNRGTKHITVSDTRGLLVGDWIKFGGSEGYNRIAKIQGKSILLEQQLNTNLKNSTVGFKEPVWKNYMIINE